MPRACGQRAAAGSRNATAGHRRSPSTSDVLPTPPADVAGRCAKWWRTTLLASPAMTSREPLPFDPILRAAALWDERIGPSRTMAAVTSVMRVQQILLSAVDGALRPHGLTFARYEALVLLSFSRSGRLPMRVMGERLQLHPDERHQHRRPAAGRRPGAPRTPPDGPARHARGDHRRWLRAALEDATKAVTDVDFGLSGLTPEEETQLTGLLSRVRHAAGDFSIAPGPDGADAALLDDEASAGLH